MKAATQLRPTRTSILVVAVLAAFSSCAPLAEVRSTKPALHAEQATSTGLRAVEEAITRGQRLEKSDPAGAIGFYLSGVQLSEQELRKDPRNTGALRNYNFALSRVFSVFRNTHLNPWIQPLRIAAPGGGQYVLIYRPPEHPLWKPQEFDLIPADELELYGKLITRRVTRSGIGAPLVVISKPGAAALQDPFVAPHIYAAATAVAHFNGRRCDLEFVDPLAVQKVSVAGRSMPCAADFTAPVAVGLAREHPEKTALAAMMNPEKFAAQARLVRIQPYDPKKIPVLFVHGLQSTPVSWVPMMNALCADPVVRRNYQAWVFQYPSGYPVPYSAMLLRRELDAVDKSFPDHRPIILVGHSMGGLLVRLMITDSAGDKVWRYYFGKPPAETALSPRTKALLKEALIFKPRPNIARAIFISTPHRGSVIAQDAIGRLASSMIHRSAAATELFSEGLRASVVEQRDEGVLRLRRMPDSIDTLSPNDAWVKVSSGLPIKKGIPYNSIIGDRGRGDTPNSSDGVVPYWSSHLDAAASEKIVSANHSANQNAQAIAEVVRILRDHIATRGSRHQRLSARAEMKRATIHCPPTPSELLLSSKD